MEGKLQMIKQTNEENSVRSQDWCPQGCWDLLLSGWCQQWLSTPKVIRVSPLNVEVYLPKLLNFNMGLGRGEMRTQSVEYLGAIKTLWSFPAGSVDKKSTCKCSSHGFNPWSRKNPHGLGQLSPCRQLLSLLTQILCMATREATAMRSQNISTWVAPTRHN